MPNTTYGSWRSAENDHISALLRDRQHACYGHVLDLPAKTGSVDPDDDFAMVYAETGKRAVRALRAIAAALESADSLILATAPDREGETIAWQVLMWLRERDAIGGRPVHRVVFHEIAQDAVWEAMAHPRGIDMDLVNAEQARQALDYLAGYALSRMLWRKLKGPGSPGRVQSVALRLICARESEIEAFTGQDYWTVDAEAAGAAGTSEGSGATVRVPASMRPASSRSPISPSMRSACSSMMRKNCSISALP